MILHGIEILILSPIKLFMLDKIESIQETLLCIGCTGEHITLRFRFTSPSNSRKS